jgi:hypothetical protein
MSNTFYPSQQDYIDKLNALAAGGSVSYATGTFTPIVIGATTAGSGTYTKQSGKTTTIGNIVTFRAEIVLSAHTGTGELRINGLPSTTDTAMSIPVACRISNSVYTGFVDAYINPSSTQIVVPGLNFGSAWMGMPFTIDVRGSYQG